MVPCNLIFIQELLSTHLITIWTIPCRSGQTKIANCSANVDFKPGSKGRLESPGSCCMDSPTTCWFSIFCGNAKEISIWALPKTLQKTDVVMLSNRWMEQDFIFEILKLGSFGGLVGGNSVTDPPISLSHCKPLGPGCHDTVQAQAPLQATKISTKPGLRHVVSQSSLLWPEWCHEFQNWFSENNIQLLQLQIFWYPTCSRKLQEAQQVEKKTWLDDVLTWDINSVNHNFLPWTILAKHHRFFVWNIKTRLRNSLCQIDQKAEKFEAVSGTMRFTCFLWPRNVGRIGGKVEQLVAA